MKKIHYHSKLFTSLLNGGPGVQEAHHISLRLRQDLLLVLRSSAATVAEGSLSEREEFLSSRNRPRGPWRAIRSRVA